MEFKPDFEAILPRMKAWWARELLDRPCIAVQAPNGRPVKPLPGPASPEAQWTDQDAVFDRVEARMAATWYGGEAIPVFWPNLGPDWFSALMGGTIEFREDTTWVAPFIHDWDAVPPLELNEERFEWKWFLEMYAKAAVRAKDRYFISAPDCHSGGDALVAMRGGMDLLLDLYDRPETIKTAMAELETAVLRFHSALRGPIEATGQPGHTCAWLQTWSPGYSNATQLDALALIAPDQFREFFRNELIAQYTVLDQAIFHLDGADAVKHLPLLCEIPALTHIQWVHGDGKGPMTKWIPLLKEIQANGRGLHLRCGPREVETLVNELSSAGLYLSVAAGSIEEGEELLRIAAKKAHV